jgi:site-specific DNA-methyltransferase (adenine-specific)
VTDRAEIIVGDALEQLRQMPAESVNCCVTSPPYWGLRDYGVAGQIGLDASLSEFLAKMVAVFEEVRRVLRKDGTCWVNLGDAYAGSTQGRRTQGPMITGRRAAASNARHRPGLSDGLKHKDLMGIPWRVAFALQDAGWFLRADIIWHKPNPMPESVMDRPSRAHEYLFLLTSSNRYHYNAKAIRETAKVGNHHRNVIRPQPSHVPAKSAHLGLWKTKGKEFGRNKRSVWTITPQPFKGAHFATFPPKLVEPCILAGCPVDGLVLDPFAGSGTTGLVALTHGRRFLGIELNPAYAEMARQRLSAVQTRIPGVA